MGYKLTAVLMNLIYPYFQQGKKKKFVTNFPVRNSLKTSHAIQVVATFFSKSDMGTSSKMSVWSLLQELLTAASPLAARKNQCYFTASNQYQW